MPDFKIHAAVICEFCRPEMNNKFTLIGTFSGDILVQEFPAHFPLATYIEVSGIPSGPHTLKYELTLPGFNFAIAGDMEVAGEFGAMPMPTANVVATEAGAVIARLQIDDGDWVVAVERKIMVGPITG